MLINNLSLRYYVTTSVGSTKVRTRDTWCKVEYAIEYLLDNGSCDVHVVSWLEAQGMDGNTSVAS